MVADIERDLNLYSTAILKRSVVGSNPASGTKSHTPEFKYGPNPPSANMKRNNPHVLPSFAQVLAKQLEQRAIAENTTALKLVKQLDMGKLAVELSGAQKLAKQLEQHAITQNSAALKLVKQLEQRAIADHATAPELVRPVKSPVPTSPDPVQIDYQKLATAIAAELSTENPPGTLAGLRQVLREQRADRDLDQATRALMVRLENKLDRILRLVEDD